MSPECQQLLKLLEDHEWHFADEILMKLSGQVAPGRAIRRYEINARNRVEKYGPRVGPELSDQEKIASGARTLVNHAMKSMSVRYIEVDDQGEVRLCRLREVPLPIHRSRNPIHPTRINAGVDDATRAAVLAAKKAGKEPEVPQGTPDPPELLTCPSCGLYVVNPDQHADWHKNQSQSNPVDLVKLEEMMRAVISAELDAFQKGMQLFLIGRFAALEVVLGERLPTKRW